MADDPTDVVRRFCDAWATGDLDAIMAFFAEDAVYHNIPLAPLTGLDAIRQTIAGFTAGAESVAFEVRSMAAAGNLVLTERVDIFRFPAGTVSLPVAGAFEIVDGRIAAWRDYFDLNQFTSQLPA